jgi:hypothetical protein
MTMHLLCLPPNPRNRVAARRNRTPELEEDGRSAEKECPPAVTHVAEAAGQTPHRTPAAADREQGQARGHSHDHRQAADGNRDGPRLRHSGDQNAWFVGDIHRADTRRPATEGDAAHDEQTRHRHQRGDNEERDASARGHASHHSEFRLVAAARSSFVIHSSGGRRLLSLWIQTKTALFLPTLTPAENPSNASGVGAEEEPMNDRCSKYVATLAAPLKHTAGSAPEDSSDASIGRAAVRGAIVGFFVVLALISTMLFTVAGVSLWVALGVGAYVGIWGGPGWGGMVAAQRHADRLAEDERRAARASAAP